MPPSEEKTGFAGLRVVAFESRRAAEMAQLIERAGGRPLVAPSMREVPLLHNTAVLDFGIRLMAGEIHMVIFLTGVGTRFMMEILESRWPRNDVVNALGRTILVARGPKPLAALRELGLKPAVAVPEPNTWKDVLDAVDGLKPSLDGMTIAVQEYGISNEALLGGLRDRGGKVVPVPVYRWALPENTEPLKQAIRAIIDGQIDVVLITNAAQADHMLRIAEDLGVAAKLRRALNTTVVASVGPTAAEHLRDCGLPVDFEPSHPKMGVLVKETGQRASDLLRRKQAQT
ncbi:MAG TPA: uroporphyrinogen-III synthase [Nitrospirales bacterium]